MSKALFVTLCVRNVSAEELIAATTLFEAVMKGVLSNYSKHHMSELRNSSPR